MDDKLLSNCVSALEMVNPTVRRFVDRAVDLCSLVNVNRLVRLADAAWMMRMAAASPGYERGYGYPPDPDSLLSVPTAGGSEIAWQRPPGGGKWPVVGVAWYVDVRRNLHVRLEGLIAHRGDARPTLFGGPVPLTREGRFRSVADLLTVHPDIRLPQPYLYADRRQRGMALALKEDPLDEAAWCALLDLSMDLQQEAGACVLRRSVEAALKVRRMLADSPVNRAGTGLPVGRQYHVVCHGVRKPGGHVVSKQPSTSLVYAVDADEASFSTLAALARRRLSAERVEVAQVATLQPGEVK